MLKFTDEESANPSGRWRRWKKQLSIEISDAVLLYRKIPLEKKNDLYNLQTFRNLLDILLDDKDINPVKIELAEYCVRKSIQLFIRELKLQNPSTPALSNVITDYLEKASEICQDISYKEKRNELSLKYSTENERYLFTWEFVSKREKGRLISYLSHVMNILVDDLKLFRYDRQNIIKGAIKDIHDLSYNIEITRDIARQKARLVVFNDDDFLEEKLFEMKIEKENHIVYYGKGDLELLREFGVNLN